MRNCVLGKKIDLLKIRHFLRDDTIALLRQITLGKLPVLCQYSVKVSNLLYINHFKENVSIYLKKTYLYSVPFTDSYNVNSSKHCV